MSTDQIASRDTTFDNIIPKHLWLKLDNIKEKDHFSIILEINGISKVLSQPYIPGLDRNEGVHLQSINLSWILQPLLKKIEFFESRASQFESTLKETMKVKDELKEKLKIATEALEFECGNRCAHQNPCNARESLEKIKKEIGT